jgi:hypothetical protein
MAASYAMGQTQTGYFLCGRMSTPGEMKEVNAAMQVPFWMK